MSTIDLSLLTKDEVRSLIGYDRGERARQYFKLDALDQSNEPVEVRAPENLRTLTPSFVQGFFGDSIIRLGEKAFSGHYKLVGFSESAKVSMRAGIDRILMVRTFDRPKRATSSEGALSAVG